MADARKTPLYDFHKQHGARFVPFGGWEMPVQYTGIKEEHQAVRRNAGLFDVSHMGEIRVRGPQALVFLDLLLTNKIERIGVGGGIYSPMCYEHGGVVDDLIAYRIGEEDYLLVVNAGNRDKDWDWVQEHAKAFDCEVSDDSDQWGLLALQGPQAEAILNRCLDGELEGLSRFSIRERSLAGASCLIARTGYTGENGFEIFVPVDRLEAVASALQENGEAGGLRLAGLGCRDSLRLEAGFPLYGHEISESIDPLTGGIGWTVKFKKDSPFLGKAALSAIQSEGLKTGVVFFVVEDRRMARQGMEVMDEGKVVGEVLSGAFSPILNQPIGSALLESDSLGSDTLALESRGKRLPLNLKTPPLHH